MSEIFLNKYLEQIQLAYEAEKKEDYVARRHHLDIAGDIVRIAAKIENNK
jgi:hypothetical protein